MKDEKIDAAIEYAESAGITANEELRSVAYLLDVSFMDLWNAFWDPSKGYV